MKFVALALALLLAVGSQAASLPADSPTTLQHVRTALDLYVTQLKESIKRIVSQLDDKEYKDVKVKVSEVLDSAQEQMKDWQSSMSSVTDSVFQTFADATHDLRANFNEDIKSLQTDLEPKRDHLKQVVEKHLEEYRVLLEPIMKDYGAKHAANMEELKTKLDAVMDQLKGLVSDNVEETKAALIPIIEAVRSKLSERLQELKTMATPYVEEYKDQMQTAFAGVRELNASEVEKLGSQLKPKAEAIMGKLQEMFADISGALSKS